MYKSWGTVFDVYYVRWADFIQYRKAREKKWFNALMPREEMLLLIVRKIIFWYLSAQITSMRNIFRETLFAVRFVIIYDVLNVKGPKVPNLMFIAEEFPRNFIRSWDTVECCQSRFWLEFCNSTLPRHSWGSSSQTSSYKLQAMRNERRNSNKRTLWRREKIFSLRTASAS